MSLAELTLNIASMMKTNDASDLAKILEEQNAVTPFQKFLLIACIQRSKHEK